MPLNIWTGMHWCSPLNQNNSNMARELLQATGRWGAVMVMGSSPGGSDTAFTYACDRVMDARQALGGGRTLDQCVARLYYGEDRRPNSTDIPNVAGADTWLRNNGYYNSLNYFVSNGGRMCVVFNELTEPNEHQRDIDPRIMGYLGYALQNAYWNGGGENRLLYTLFPGPSGLQGFSGFQSYFDTYDLRDANHNPQTFGQKFPGQVDPTIANRTMLHHGGSGVFDRVALHCYANSPTEFGSANVGGNQALQYIQWLLTTVDSSGWVYVTESGGALVLDDYDNGVNLANFEQNVSDLNAVTIPNGGFGGQVQAVHGYILDISNAGASRNNVDRFSCRAVSGYNYRRAQLGF